MKQQCTKANQYNRAPEGRAATLRQALKRRFELTLQTQQSSRVRGTYKCGTPRVTGPEGKGRHGALNPNLVRLIIIYLSTFNSKLLTLYLVRLNVQFQDQNNTLK